MNSAKHFDPIVGIDVHLILTPAGVTVPVPHPFVGIVVDVMDYVPILGATVFVNGVPVGVAGTGGKAIPPHIPIGGTFVKIPPGNEGEIFMGSSTVIADGEPMSYMGLPVLTCSDIGMPAPPRKKAGVKSLSLPTSVVLPIPIGMPVVVGGSPTISMMGMAFKLGLAGLKKLRKSDLGEKFSEKVHKAGDSVLNRLGVKSEKARNKVHRAICTVTGHPVDVATGKVFTDAVDIELPGPIPFTWERVWFSTSTYPGSLGHGWHSNYDLALIEADHKVTIRLADGRTMTFPSLRVGQEGVSRKEKMTLFRDERGYGLRTSEKLNFRFGFPHAHPQPGSAIDPTAVQVLLSIEDFSGHAIRFFYGPGNVLREIIDSSGRTLSLHSDSKGRITAIAGPHPQLVHQQVMLVRYVYNSEGDLVEVIDALEQRARYAYRQHLLTQETNRNGLRFSFEYDGSDETARCIRTWGDGGIYDHKLRYDEESNTIEVENSLGHVTTYIRDKNGLIVQTIDALGHKSNTTYDSDCLKILEIDSLGQKTAYEYDEHGYCTKVVHPDGTSMEVVYDALGNPTQAVDALKNAWHWDYDVQGRMVARHSPDGGITRFVYREGHLSHLMDAAGHTSTLSYDTQGNLIALQIPNGGIHRWRYDTLGRCLEAQDPKSNRQLRSVDLLGRVVEVSEPDGNLRRFAYDPEGNVVRAHDRHHDVAFTYQGMGRLTSRKEAGTSVEFHYDTEEQLVGIRNEHGLVYRFELDATGEVWKESGFDNRTRIYTRDAAGRVISVQKPSGQTSGFSYDPHGRIIQVQHSDGTTEHYAYRADGELMHAANQHITVTFERDALGRVTRERQGAFWVASRYDKQGMRVEMRSSLGALQHIKRNAVGEVTHIEANQESAHGNTPWHATFERDMLGHELERSLPGGLKSRWLRDKLGRPIQHHIWTNHHSLRSKQYVWDVNHRLKQITDELRGPTVFQHDALGNLVSAQYPDGSLDLRMPDAVGNLFRSKNRDDRVYGRAGELLEARTDQGLVLYSYDKDGNLLSKVLADTTAFTYTWNAAGMLETVTRPDGDVVSFTYDALGRRLSKTFRNKITRWVWDGNLPLHEWVVDAADFDPTQPDPLPTLPIGEEPPLLDTLLAGHPPTGPPTSPTAWLQAEKRHVPPKNIITWLFEPESFSPMAKMVAGEAYSILTDHLGTPVCMVHSDGEQVWAAETGIDGQLRTLKGLRQACPFRFPGQYEDVETGLYYNRFRYYDPQVGAYVSQDPIGFHGGIALYAYVHDPLAWIDPLGLQKDCPPEEAGDKLATELETIFPGTSKWKEAVQTLQKGGKSNFRVPSSTDAKALLKEGRGNMNRYKRYTNKKYNKGYEVHPNEAHTRNAPHNDLDHVKWKDWHSDDAPGSGHIFFDKPN